jgi:hypothetical protein
MVKSRRNYSDQSVGTEIVHNIVSQTSRFITFSHREEAGKSACRDKWDLPIWLSQPMFLVVPADVGCELRVGV